MDAKEISTNNYVREKIGRVLLAPKFADIIKRNTEITRYCKDEEQYLNELSIIRIYWAVNDSYGARLTEYILSLPRQDLILLENSFRICAGLPKTSEDMGTDHIPVQYIYRSMYEDTQKLSNLSDTVLRLLSYNAYTHTIPNDYISNEAPAEYLKYTGYSVYPAALSTNLSALKKKLLAEARGEFVEITPKYLEYREFLLGLDEAERRYFFISSEESVREFLTLPKARRKTYIEMYMKWHPWGLPTPGAIHTAILDISYIIPKNKREGVPRLREDKSLPPLKQSMIAWFFGACYSDVYTWFGGESKVAEELRDTITCVKRMEPYSDIQVLHSILEIAASTARIRYICRLRSQTEAYKEFESNLLCIAHCGLVNTYIHKLMRAFNNPLEVTPEAIRWHFINYILDFTEEDCIQTFGYKKHDLAQCINYENVLELYFINVLVQGKEFNKNLYLPATLQERCADALNIYSRLSCDSQKYYLRQGVASFIELARQSNHNIETLEDIAVKCVPNLRKQIFQKNIPA